MTTPFNTSEIFFCQWQHGAKEYFNTIEEAIEKANSHYKRTKTMTDENFAYWLTQKFIIGKELTVTQELELIECTCPVS